MMGTSQLADHQGAESTLGVLAAETLIRASERRQHGNSNMFSTCLSRKDGLNMSVTGFFYFSS